MGRKIATAHSLYETPNGFSISREDLDGILSNCDAMSDYWIDGVEYDKGEFWFSPVLCEGSVKIHCGLEEGEEKIISLDLNLLLKGIDSFLAQNPKYKDTDKYDLACDADSDEILQYACFGELIYG